MTKSSSTTIAFSGRGMNMDKLSTEEWKTVCDLLGRAVGAKVSIGGGTCSFDLEIEGRHSIAISQLIVVDRSK